MYLENLVFDAVEPQELGRFWEAALGCERLTDEPDAFETRFAIDGGPVLDLCFQRASEPQSEPPRLHLDLEGRAAYTDTGPLAALTLDSAEPARDAEFWSWLTGWTEVAPRTLRHPSLLGPLLELIPEPAPKGTTKNPLHLDVRLETGDDADDVAASIAEHGGREIFYPEWGELPWRFYEDPSGNDFCVLPAPPDGATS